MTLAAISRFSVSTTLRSALNQLGVNLLLFFAEVETWCSLLDHHARDAFCSFTAGPHHYNVHVCVSSAADEGLKSKPDVGPGLPRRAFTEERRFEMTFDPFKM